MPSTGDSDDESSKGIRPLIEAQERVTKEKGYTVMCS
jgi:hypothetical protein